MAKFNIDKKGYNTTEVDEYISNLYLKYEEKLAEQKDRVVALKNEVETLNEKLSGFLNKDEQISKALIYAVEKSEQIENNAKTVYNLEIKRINALYARWEELLLEVENKCPEVNSNKYINSLIEDFKNTITDINSKSLTFDSKSIKEELKHNSDNFIKNILNKMDYVVNSKPVSIVTPKQKKSAKEVVTASDESKQQLTVETPKNETDNLKVVSAKKKVVEINEVKKPEASKSQKPEITTQKSFSVMNSINERLSKLGNKSNSNTSLAEKYLNSDDELKINAYAKNFTKKKLEKKNVKSSPFNYMEYPEPNESGFDLKDALNPKEDLDEIMKAFDFFDEEK